MRGLIFLLLITGNAMAQVQAAASSMSLYDFTVEDVNGQSVKLAEFRGQVALVVNTASNCGFTGQYAGLQELYEKYKERGFVVLAFPSNDFGGQEPGSNSEIKSFCTNKYSVTFPIFAKAPVAGKEKQPVYKFLTEDSFVDYQGDPGWNFVKFLVDQQGQVVGRFSSMTKPMSSKITKAIEVILVD